jgi:hypothetical protein
MTVGFERGAILIAMANDQVTINQLVVGFCRAYYRFLSEDQGEDAQSLPRAYMALFEALNWADAADAFLRRGPEVRGGDPQWPERLPANQREVVEGVQHARNVVHHQWWDAIATEMQMEDDWTVNAWIWSDLPKRKNRDRDGRRAYNAALRGKPIADTLELLRDAFWSVRRWEIKADLLDQPAYPLAADAPVD